MSSKKQIAFIVNPISGTSGKENILRLIDERLDKGVYNYVIKKTKYAGHAEVLAKEAVKGKIDIVVAIGGDGTINEVGRSLIHTNTAMGIIPCGSGNGLARHLHIPLDPKGAIDTLNKGQCIQIDYGKINERPFFCTCGVGFDAFVSMKFASSKKRGLLTYLENTLQEGLRYHPETYEIENESGSMKYKAFLIACANASQYGNNAYIAPKASLTDGEMDITILEPFTMLEAPAISFQLFSKTINQNWRIKTLKEKKITIHRTSEGVFHFDGDPAMGSKDLEVEIVPRGLNIIVPEKGSSKPFYNTYNLFQYFMDMVGRKPITETIVRKHHHLLQINQNILRRLSKKN